MIIYPVIYTPYVVHLSLQHFFFEYMISNFTWNLCFKWFGVLTTQYNKTLQHFDQFYLHGLNIKENKLWKVIWVAMIRSIWHHRNSIVFRNNTVKSLDKVEKQIIKGKFFIFWLLFMSKLMYSICFTLVQK